MPTYRACRDSVLGDQEVRGVDGAALGDVHVAAVAELGAAREVGPGDPERLGPGPVQALPPHLGVRSPPPGDFEGVPVGESAAAGVDLGVQAGADQVTGPGVVAVRQHRLRRADVAELDEPGLDPAGQFGGFGVRPGQQQHVLTAQVVGEPHRRGAVVGGFLIGASDPAVPVVGGDCGPVAVTEPDAGLPLPRRLEAADLVQLRRGDFGASRREHSSGFDRAELRRCRR